MLNHQQREAKIEKKQCRKNMRSSVSATASDVVSAVQEEEEDSCSDLVSADEGDTSSSTSAELMCTHSMSPHHMYAVDNRLYVVWTTVVHGIW